jgi:pimeloyl-ACP methyl ester carboxylesterase
MLLTVPIGYVLIVVAVGIFQRRLIYFPTRFAVNVAEQSAAQNGFAPWRDAGGEIIGWKMAANGTARGSVLVIHGNAGCALDRDYLARPIHAALPVDVYVLEYPGYGARAGSPNLGSLLAAGEQALASLPGDLPVYLVSESLGAGVAAHLAKAQPERIKGLAMFVPYDDLGSVGQASMPFLPVKLVMRDRFQPARWLADYRGPVKVVLAGADEVIPTKFGQRLYDRYQGPKSLHLVPHARHNEVAEQTPEWWCEVFAFWQQTSSTPPVR